MLALTSSCNGAINFFEVEDLMIEECFRFGSTSFVRTFAPSRRSGYTLMFVAFFVVSFSGASALAGTHADGKTILDTIDDMYRGESSKGKMTMQVKTEYWQRTLQIEIWSKGTTKSLMRILSPKKEKGTTTLRVDDNMWNYLPKVKRVMKVPTSMMGGSWMGSHFTNDDLVKESRMSLDYDFEVSPIKNGRIDITCIPKPEAAVVWGKIIVQVETHDAAQGAIQYLPLKIDYYDEDLTLMRTMSFHDYKKVNGRTIALRTRMQPHDTPEEFTEVIYSNIEFDIKLNDSLFSLRRLQR